MARATADSTQLMYDMQVISLLPERLMFRLCSDMVARAGKTSAQNEIRFKLLRRAC